MSLLLQDAPRWLFLLLTALLIGNVAGVVFVGAHTDEAYYWMLSQRPGLSYFDHPPLVPWMMRLFTALFGHDEVVFRLPAVIAWFVAAWAIFSISHQLSNNRQAAWVSLLVFASLPIFQAGFQIVGPDSGLMLFTALTYYCAIRAVNQQSALWWLLAGICTGLGMLSKYNAVLVPFAVFLTLVLSKRGREQMLTPWPWAAGFLALFCFIPVLIWNYQNEWASFAFQWKHGTDIAPGSWYDNLSLYIINQMGVVLPWVFIAMVVAAVKAHHYASYQNPYTLKLMRVGFAVPLVFFGVTGLLVKGQASWPAMAYIPGSILLGIALNQWISKRWVAIIVMFSVMLSLVFVNLLRFPQWTSWFEKGTIPRSHISNTFGWEKILAEVEAIRAEEAIVAGNNCRIMAVPGYDNGGFPYYLLAAKLGVEYGNALRVTAAPGGRLTQFDFWRKQETDKTPPVCVLITGPSTRTNSPAEMIKDNKTWQRKNLVEITAPDGSVRWYGIYSQKR
ncbi:MAG: glycosyltransferase family 39 protein [Acidiferrobacterales bacterium]